MNADKVVGLIFSGAFLGFAGYQLHRMVSASKKRDRAMEHEYRKTQETARRALENLAEQEKILKAVDCSIE